jgi:hypothetical protein
MNIEIKLFEKEGFILTRMKKNNYKIDFCIENNNIILSKIIDFNLIKLIYDLNLDVYEKVELEIINDDEAIVITLMKHLFEELGLPQKYSYLHIKREITNKKIIFRLQTIQSYRPINIPIDAELMEVESMISICDIITPHKINFSFSIMFEANIIIQPFIEKIICTIFHKIFKRVKQFIEKAHII